MKQLESVVIMFSGDSGDGMQMTGTQFSNASARMGNDLATFPDFPSEIRAPQGTIAGVSGFQIQFGATEITTPGDDPDVLVAFNPASLKANIKNLKKSGVILANTDAFDEKNLEKAGYKTNPLVDGSLTGYQLVAVPIVQNTLQSLQDLELDQKTKLRCKNMYALGIIFSMFGRDMTSTIDWINGRFSQTHPTLAKANQMAMESGFHYAEKTDNRVVKFEVAPAKISQGTYRQISGNQATAWGLMQGAESAGLQLFLGSYPITPATDILHELSKHKEHGVKTYQAEDEIAGICSAIGASFGGAMAATTTSGPGLALKGEALGLATIYEIPLVIVNVQRGGPSTGLPTKTEQSDLLQAMYGRNGECPMIVLAASRPNDCFHMAYEACRLTLEHMTPVILLTDGYIGNGSEPWLLPKPNQYKTIKTKLVDATNPPKDGGKFMSYARDPETLVRQWAVPGMKGYEHRIGGLEKQDITGSVSHDGLNHQKMTDYRQKKVDLVANNIPLQELEGEASGDLLVLSWGGTYGSTHTAVAQARSEGKKVSLCHLKYINPMPKNIPEILGNFKRVLIPEINMGQLKFIIDAKFKRETTGLHKMQGKSFKVSELMEAINRELERV